MISAAGFSLISRGSVVRVAASSGRRLICESILDGRRNGESQDRLVVVHVGVKQGLHHGEGEFGVLGAGGSILSLLFGRMP